MKLVTYAVGRGKQVGVQLRDGVHNAGFEGDMVGLIERWPRAAEWVQRCAERAPAVRRVRLLAPLRPRSMRVFLSFERHLQASMRGLGWPVPRDWYEVPAYYKVIPDTVIGPDETIPWPSFTGRLDFELGIACVIGRKGRDIPRERALEHVFGWTIWNDVSARDVQARELPVGMGPAKAKEWDGSNVLGPCIVTMGNGFDASRLRMAVRVNGELRGTDNTAGMHHKFVDLIAYASQAQTLYPGDVLAAGSAAGSGVEVDRWLQSGDLVEMEIEGIGVLSNRVGPRGAPLEPRR
jgi:2-keto-4-pentenoate hydratase/2-oxohepta-3-ene-1,7-dioic acid hydratase in catechol pathway